MRGERERKERERKERERKVVMGEESSLMEGKQKRIEIGHFYEKESTDNEEEGIAGGSGEVERRKQTGKGTETKE